ncbi:MAG: hypothetical protein JKY65_16380 [Planctomycetes bacterium]|nr:hypothetical protein [Planctomycetota bacterium]
MTHKLLLPLALATLLLAGCPAPAQKTDASPAASSTATPAASASPAASREISKQTLPVICGCAVDSIGQCGEFAVIDGKHVEITDHGLGAMPFCGKGKELKATVSGTLVEGKLKATAIEVLK